MAARGAVAEDVRGALVFANACRATADGKWKITGPDLDGDELKVVAVVEGDVVVITVF